MASSYLFFTPYYDIAPADLRLVEQPIPLLRDEPTSAEPVVSYAAGGEIVPLGVYDRLLEFVLPDLAELGNGAIRLTLGKPFSIMEGVGGYASDRVTQETDGINLLASNNTPGEWCAELATKKPPTEQDAMLFRGFVDRYVLRAGIKITAARGQS